LRFEFRKTSGFKTATILKSSKSADMLNMRSEFGIISDYDSLHYGLVKSESSAKLSKSPEFEIVTMCKFRGDSM
jgi:hypothetical protein